MTLACQLNPASPFGSGQTVTFGAGTFQSTLGSPATNRALTAHGYVWNYNSPGGTLPTLASNDGAIHLGAHGPPAGAAGSTATFLGGQKQVANIPFGTTIRVRAYVTQITSGATAYSASIQYTPTTIPTVSATAVPTNVTLNDAQSGGTIGTDGGATILERGILVSVVGHQNNYTNHDFKFAVAGTGSPYPSSFARTCDGLLAPNTQYHVNAFARNANSAAGTASLGPQQTFTTPPVPQIPTLANQVSPVFSDGSHAFVSALVTSDGNYPITRAGTVWMLKRGVPTDAEFRLNQPGVNFVDAAPVPQQGQVFDQNLIVAANLPGSDSGGGERVWFRAYAQNGHTGGTYGYSTPQFAYAPVIIEGGLLEVSGGFLVADLESYQSLDSGIVVDLIGFCEVPPDSYGFEPDSTLIAPDAYYDPACVQTNVLAGEIDLQASDLDVPQEIEAALREDTDLLGELETPADIMVSNRPFHNATSQHRREPMRRTPDRILGTDGRIARGEVLGLAPPPPPPPNGIPVPRHVRATSDADAVVTVTWDANGAALRYEYEMQIDPDPAWSDPVLVFPPSHSSVPLHLDHDVKYRFRVRLVTAQGTSDWAHYVAIRTPPAGPDELIIDLPLSAMDPTGVHDVSAQLFNWVRDHVPHGPSVENRIRVRSDPSAIYRIEGDVTEGVVFQQPTNVIWDGGGSAAKQGKDGTQFVSKTKLPFALKKDATNPAGLPTGKWNVLYAPLNKVKTSFVGTIAGQSAQDRAQQVVDDSNRDRSLFRMRRAVNFSWIGCRFTGSYGGGGAGNAVEAQDGIVWEGGRTVEIGFCTVERLWGNGWSTVLHDDGTDRQAPVGVWDHDNDLHTFGRQAITTSSGGHFIVENTDLDGANNSILDAEPTSAHVEPGLDAPVDGIYLLGVTIGANQGGIGLHAGVKNVRVAGCDGFPGLPSGCAAESVIFENNRDDAHQELVSSYGCRFIRLAAADPNNAIGQDWGGRDLIVRNNPALVAHLAAAKFEAGCDRYLSAGNIVHDTNGQPRGQVPVGDDPSVNPPALTLPTPAHAIRDL